MMIHSNTYLHCPSLGVDDNTSDYLMNSPTTLVAQPDLWTNG